MPELSKSFKIKLLSDMRRAMAHPGSTISLQEGGMQFPGTPPIQIRYVSGTQAPDAGFAITIGKYKSPGDWTLEAAISPDQYTRAGAGDGVGDGVIAGLLRLVAVQAGLQPYGRSNAHAGLQTGYYAINAFPPAKEKEGPTLLHLTIHKDNERIVGHSLEHLQGQTNAAEDMTKAETVAKSRGGARGAFSSPQ